MWGKMAMLAPNALSTSAANGPVGLVRSTPRWQAKYEACVREACAVAEAEGVHIDPDELIAATAARFEDKHRTSMQKDIEAGRRPELDAIGGALLRAAHRHGIPAPVTEELVRLVAERARLGPADRGGWIEPTLRRGMKTHRSLIARHFSLRYIRTLFAPSDPRGRIVRSTPSPWSGREYPRLRAVLLRQRCPHHGPGRPHPCRTGESRA